MENLAQRVNALNELVSEFRYPEAFDAFYDESVLNYENEQPPLVGLQAEREAMANYLASITNESAKRGVVIIADDTSVTEWLYEFTHKDWGHRKYTQITVQRWKDGKVILQRHHYATA